MASPVRTLALTIRTSIPCVPVPDLFERRLFDLRYMRAFERRFSAIRYPYSNVAFLRFGTPVFERRYFGFRSRSFFLRFSPTRRRVQGQPYKIGIIAVPSRRHAMCCGYSTSNLMRRASGRALAQLAVWRRIQGSPPVGALAPAAVSLARAERVANLRPSSDDR